MTGWLAECVRLEFNFSLSFLEIVWAINLNGMWFSSDSNNLEITTQIQIVRSIIMTKLSLLWLNE